jgi:hypothetical protein
MRNKRNILGDKIRVYGAACEPGRTARLLSQIRNLGCKDWKIAVEKPGNAEEYGKILLDPPSRRFRHQLTVDVHRPFVWLEDDACIMPDFQEQWKPFNDSLPKDWKIAVIGWGFLYDDEGVQWHAVNDHWLQVSGGKNHWGAYCGAHCTIVHSGRWRLELAKHEF